MATNDFVFASTLLHPDFEYYMPQTREYLKGPANFAALNTGFPADGLWQFQVADIISNSDTVVSDVTITDGTLQARAITFHTISDGLIRRQKEYWPENYSQPTWRKQWTTCISDPPF